MKQKRHATLAPNGVVGACALALTPLDVPRGCTKAHIRCDAATERFNGSSARSIAWPGGQIGSVVEGIADVRNHRDERQHPAKSCLSI